MTYTLLANGVIARSDGSFIPPDPANVDYQTYLAWVAAGNTAAAPAAPTYSQLVMQCTEAVQAQMDAYAQSWGYGGIMSAASYVVSSNSKFKAEGTALSNWRDQVWAWAESTEAAINAGTQAMPTSISAFLAGMPAAPARPAS